MTLDEVIAHLMEVRKEQGLTQTELAEMMGTTHGHISRLERRLQDPTQETLEKWADALGMTHGHALEERRAAA